MVIDDLKLLLGIGKDDSSKDDLLNLLIKMSTSRLKALLGGIDPPSLLDHIILEVSIARFNRIGSEGLSSHGVEGESLSFNDDDFKPYAEEIQAYLDTQKDNTKGKLRFL